MTREEAISYGNNYYIELISACCEIDEKHKEFVRMSLKALEQEPCEDVISREKTLKAMIEQLGIRNEDYLLPAEATLYKVVKNMPPVTPQPKTGHWINTDATHSQCDRCGAVFEIASANGEANFCPNCGAKMESEE